MYMNPGGCPPPRPPTFYWGAASPQNPPVGGCRFCGGAEGRQPPRIRWGGLGGGSTPKFMCKTYDMTLRSHPSDPWGEERCPDR